LLRQHAKQLRTEQTEAELKLWYHLRAHRFEALKFRRQRPMGPYIVDFVCIDCSLVIEVDGGQHSEQAHYDQVRDQFLKSQGLRVTRFWNTQVLQELPAVLEQIRLAALAGRPSPPTSLPLAGEGS